jgi:hypothetical protein
MTVDSIEIWQSQLLPTGAVYASLGEVRLGWDANAVIINK